MKEKNSDKTASNERFCVIAAVTTPIMQWELASYSPAANSLEAATTQSRHHVRRQRGTARWRMAAKPDCYKQAT